MPTFEESVATVTSPEALALAEVKKTFTATLAELRELQHAFSKQKPAWVSRGNTARAHARAQAAKGVRHSRVEYLLKELFGGRSSVIPGLIYGTENQIAANIQTIERMNRQDLPQRHSWLSWYGFPENIRNIMRTIEQYLEELEALVKDGGELHQRLDEKSKKEG